MGAQKITPNHARELQSKGLSIDEIAETNGMGKRAVYAALKRPEPKPRSAKPWHAEARRLAAKGEMIKTIAFKCGVRRDTVSKLLRGCLQADMMKKDEPDQELALAFAVPVYVDEAEIWRLHTRRVRLTHIAASLRIPYARVIEVIEAGA